MFRPYLQKTWVLFSLALFTLSMVYIGEINIAYEKSDGYDYKLKAAEIMEESLSVLKEEINNKYPNKHILKDIDPNLTGLIFNLPQSPLTTDSGSLESKQTVLKPIFAALIVDLFVQAGLSRGDTIAVGMTGSMPGANIALHSACEAMGIVPAIITSIGASEWGATDSNFTWLDLESILYTNNIIANKSIAASLGGKNDGYKKKKKKNINYGGPEGKKLAEDAIARHGLEKLYKVKERISVYENFIKGKNLNNYLAYVNIGGGVSSIGVRGNKKLKKPGIIDPDLVKVKITDNCVIKEFANIGVILINIHNIPKLIKDEFGRELISYGARENRIGIGPLFENENKHEISTFFNYLLVLLLTLIVVIVIAINSFRQINKHMNSYETESIL